LIFAIDLAVRAGTTAMLYYNSTLKENLTLDQRKNAATDADSTAQVQVVSQLLNSDKYGKETIISEEEPYSQAKVNPDGFTWVIDPLDGTSNFWNRIPLFCSAIGVLKNGKPFIGALFEPISNEIYYAIDGQPSQVWRMSTGESSFITADQRTTDPRQAIIGTHISTRPQIARKMFNSGTLSNLSNKFKHVRVLGCGQLALAYVATGRLQAFFQYGSYIWDQVAGVVIVQNSGGIACTASRSMPNWNYKTSNILACSNLAIKQGFRESLWPAPPSTKAKAIPKKRHLTKKSRRSKIAPH
jgi:myo-inositol-1(or 4)-monophosphatase